MSAAGLRTVCGSVLKVARIFGASLPGSKSETMVYDQRGFSLLALVACSLALHHFPIFGPSICTPTHLVAFGGARGRLGDVALLSSVLAYFFLHLAASLKLPYARATHNSDMRGLVMLFGATIAAVYSAAGFYGRLSPFVSGMVVVQLSVGAFLSSYIDEAGAKGFGIPGVSLYALAANAAAGAIPTVFGVLRALYTRDGAAMWDAAAMAVVVLAAAYVLGVKLTVPVTVPKAPMTPVPPSPLRIMESSAVLPVIGVLIGLLDVSRILAVMTSVVSGGTLPSFPVRASECTTGIPAAQRVAAGGLLPVAVPRVSFAPSLIPSIAVTLFVCVMVMRRLYPSAGSVMELIKREGLAPKGAAESVVKHYAAAGADVGGIILCALIVFGDVFGGAFGGCAGAAVAAAIAAALCAFKQIFAPEIYRGMAGLLQLPF